jgi:hypothetical protein
VAALGTRGGCSTECPCGTLSPGASCLIGNMLRTWILHFCFMWLFERLDQRSSVTLYFA